MEGASQWRFEMFAENGCMGYVEEFLGLLDDKDVLLRCGFCIPTEGDELPFDENNELVVEDEFAAMQGQLCWGFLRNIVRRDLMLFGPPYNFTKCRASEDKAKADIARLKEDYDIHDAMKHIVGPTRKELNVIKRSRMQLKPVQHLLELCKLTHSKYDGPLKDTVENRDLANISTGVIENMNGIQKGFAASVAGQQWKAPETLLAACLESQLVEKRFDFKDVAVDVPFQSLRASIPDDGFRTSKELLSMSFDEMVSTSQHPSWWSPSVANISTPEADVYVSRVFSDQKNLRQWEALWMGKVSHIRHKICLGFRKPGKGLAQYTWYVAVDVFNDSGILVWPVELVDLGAGITWARPVCKQVEPTILPMNSMQPAKVKSFQYVWRSWAWQWTTLPAYRWKLTPGSRMFMGPNGIESVPVTANRCAWWRISRTDLIPFAKSLGVPVESADGLFEVLWKLSKKTLKLNDAETLKNIQPRISAMQKLSYSPALLEVEESINVLEQHDIEKVTAAKKKMQDDVQATSDFRNAYFEKASFKRVFMLKLVAITFFIINPCSYTGKGSSRSRRSRQSSCRQRRCWQGQRQRQAWRRRCRPSTQTASATPHSTA